MTDDKGIFTVLKDFSGGKSGDKVMLVLDQGDEKVMKLSTKKSNIYGEASTTLFASSLFDGYDHNPIVDVYGYGMARYEGKMYYYYLMQKLGHPYVELDKIIRETCAALTSHSSSEDVREAMNNIREIYYNIFQVIKVLKLNHLSHCDLHTKNIFVDNNLKIKIIDFGLATILNCKKKREETGAILDTYKKCIENISFLSRQKITLQLYLKLIKGEILKSNDIDSDISMFITIVSIFFRNEPIIEKLYKLSSDIFNDLQTKNMIRLKEHLDMLEEDLIRLLFTETNFVFYKQLNVSDLNKRLVKTASGDSIERSIEDSNSDSESNEEYELPSSKEKSPKRARSPI